MIIICFTVLVYGHVTDHRTRSSKTGMPKRGNNTGQTAFWRLVTF